MNRPRSRLDEIEALYRLRYEDFLRVAAAITRDVDTGADAVHDAFVRAVRHRRGFRGEGTLEAWLWKIVVHVARSRARRAASPAVLGAVSAEPHSNGSAVSAELRAAIAALPERQRVAVFLRYYADLDYAAIAAALAIREGTVAATLNSARSALRRVLTEVPSAGR